MKTSTKVTIAAAAALLAGTAAIGVSQADSYGGGRYFGGHHGKGMGDHDMRGRGGGHSGHGMLRMFESFDANADGKLTQAEIDEARAAQLARFDADGNGSLELAEYQALWADAMRPRMVDRFQDLDDDGDGAVTKDEYSRPFARAVRYMDSNDDGAIGRDDMGRHRYDRDRDDD